MCGTKSSINTLFDLPIALNKNLLPGGQIPQAKGQMQEICLSFSGVCHLTQMKFVGLRGLQ